MILLTRGAQRHAYKNPSLHVAAVPLYDNTLSFGITRLLSIYHVSIGYLSRVHF